MQPSASETAHKKEKPTQKDKKKGDKKNARSTTGPPSNTSSQNQSVKENHSKDRKGKWNTQSLTLLGIVSLISLITKFYGISKPNEVVFDEVHFGKFASQYITREYFFDVHPPLGKLLFAAVGYLFGYDGTFSFEKIGLSYSGSQVPYVAMRSLSAICGTLIVTVVYAILIQMKFSLTVAILGSCMIAFDNALITQCRYILLDAQLMFLIITSCFCWVKFRSRTKHPFTLSWWFWLLATGLFLGLTTSVKLIGLFMVAVVGVCTLLDLWDVTGIRKTPKEITVAFHWVARIVCLVGIPVIVFCIPYWVHFEVANRSGSGDFYMSNEFQATLKGNKISDTATPVFYGSIIKILNNAEKMYLNSHQHNYPLKHADGKVSSKGQQVTGFSEPDDNNDWMILPAITDPPIDYLNNTKIPVRNGDLVRLLHLSTEKYLLTHDVASPFTNTNQEVTAVDVQNATDEKYNKTLWKIDIIRGSKILESKLTLFRLHHPVTRTNLLNFPKTLPDWGFGHREINAGRVDDKRTWWTIDEVFYDEANETMSNQTEAQLASDHEMTFWEKLSELLSVSVEKNAEIVDKSPYITTPSQWPFLVRGTSFWVSTNKKERIYLLGNPLTWFISIFSLPIFLALIAIDQLFQLRGEHFLTPEQRKFLYPKGLFFLLCYALHYLPFFAMGRVVYFHHYLPCYLFNALIFTTLYQVVALRFTALKHPAVVGVICSLIVGVFLQFSALTYGTSHDEEYFNSLKMISTWHF